MRSYLVWATWMASLWVAGTAARAADTDTPGRALYRQRCATCHGAELQGGNAQSLVDGTWQFGEGRGYVFRNIKFGLPSHGMPSFGEVMTDREIHAVIDYLEALENTAGVRRPPPPSRLETLDYHIDVSVWAEGLATPWAVAFPDARHALITERPGRLRVVEDGNLLPDPVAGTPAVLAEGQGGLLDVAVDPGHATNGWIYLAYSHAIDAPAGPRPAMTRVVRGRIRDHAWTDEQVVFEAPHATYRTTRHHYGSRIVFDPQGYLYFSIGDRGAGDQAQDPGRPNGKIHRLFPDGRIPPDNPFTGRAGALPSVYSYGHRNPQGLAVDPVSGRVWALEHGPMGGDELNRIGAGLNYGWPVVTYGLNYDGSVISAETRRPGMEPPNLYWRPSIAVCGLSFCRGTAYPKWAGKLLVSALRFEEVRLVEIEGDRVIHQEVILKNAGRVRTAVEGPDGALYVVLNSPDLVLRLAPAKTK